jgi:hypothetical protein
MVLRPQAVSLIFFMGSKILAIRRAIDANSSMLAAAGWADQTAQGGAFTPPFELMTVNAIAC